MYIGPGNNGVATQGAPLVRGQDLQVGQVGRDRVDQMELGEAETRGLAGEEVHDALVDVGGLGAHAADLLHRIHQQDDLEIRVPGLLVDSRDQIYHIVLWRPGSAGSGGRSGVFGSVL